MTRIKFLAGLIAGGIIVAAIIAIFVMRGSTELTSEDFTEMKDNVIGTDPTKITKFSIKERGDMVILSITVDGKIPYDGKQLPISESAKAFGYAWLRLDSSSDQFHHTPDQLIGYMASIKPGDDGLSPEKWWNVESVNILQMDPDNPKLCFFYSQKTEGIISVTENELRVDVIPNRDFSSLFGYRAIVIEIEENETCLTGKGVHILDTYMK